ncbi:MAG TPA: hypothetical protein H9957_00640, partial [Candidatus Dorea stercoravium]|nr:hypothetical protein [Candidatus Dorea stercoravium]
FQSAFSQAERIFTARIPKAEKQILKSTKRIPQNHQSNDLWYPLRTFAKLYNGGAIGISASFLGLRVRKTD